MGDGLFRFRRRSGFFDVLLSCCALFLCTHCSPRFSDRFWLPGCEATFLGGGPACASTGRIDSRWPIGFATTHCFTNEAIVGFSESICATAKHLANTRETEVGKTHPKTRAARQKKAALSFDRQQQVRIATAVSEIARNAFRYASDATAEFSLTRGRTGASRRIT
jgi:hypothetical protein